MASKKTLIRLSILWATLLFLASGPVLAGGIAIVSTHLTDNGDNDGFADSHETVTLTLTVRNTSGAALSNVTATLYSLTPDLACPSKPQLVIGNLADGQTVTTTDSFVFTVSGAADRTTLGIGPYEALTAEFDVLFDSDSGPVQGFSQDLTLDLDLDVTGGSGTASYSEDFESQTLGTFHIENIDSGRFGLANSDGYRCQYNDPDNPNGNSPGSTVCYLGIDPAHTDAVWWQLSGPSFSPAGGRGFSGFHSLFFGVDLGPPKNWTTPMAVLEGVGMTDAVHIAPDAVEPTLVFKQQVSLADGRAFALPYKETYDAGVVMVQVADDNGDPAGPWFKVDPYQNPYDQQNSPIIINCSFDPVDDSSTEDDYYAPGDPNRKTGPSSTCFPEYIYANMGETSSPYDPVNLGFADGPGLAGLWGIGTWVESKVDLSRFRGRSIRVRFVASSLEANPNPFETWDDLFGLNPNSGDDGWWLDDIEITGLVSTAATVALDNTDNSALPGPSGVDIDVDGFIDSCDNCPSTANSNQFDGDQDTLGDVCDICPYNTENVDPDLDTICGSSDNCPTTPNPAQTDSDNDGFGAACDCNDANFSINPDQVETNDGVDEDCDTAVDELSGVTVSKSGTTATFDWPPQALAQRYRMARSSSAAMDLDCGGQNLFSNSWNETTVLPAHGVLYLVFRATQPNLGSWGLRSDGTERTGACVP